jgi:hypothetical protein
MPRGLPRDAVSGAANYFTTVKLSRAADEYAPAAI